MSRVKRSVFSKKKHNKIFKNTKSFIGRRKNVLRISKQAFIKKLSYHYRDTRKKKRHFKNKWIKTINFFLLKNKTKYKDFIFLLKKNKININRKILFEILNLKEISNVIFDKILSKIKGC